MGERKVVHQGVMLLSLDMLAGSLLPKGARILRVRESHQIDRALEIVIEHPELPETEMGGVLPLIAPSVKLTVVEKDEGKSVMVVLEDWGVVKCG